MRNGRGGHENRAGSITPFLLTVENILEAMGTVRQAVYLKKIAGR